MTSVEAAAVVVEGVNAGAEEVKVVTDAQTPAPTSATVPAKYTVGETRSFLQGIKLGEKQIWDEAHAAGYNAGYAAGLLAAHGVKGAGKGPADFNCGSWNRNTDYHRGGHDGKGGVGSGSSGGSWYGGGGGKGGRPRSNSAVRR